MGAISQIDIPHQGLYTRNLLLMDEYSHKQDSKGFITVKPPEIGRSQGCETVIAIGVSICFEKSAKGIESELKGARATQKGLIYIYLLDCSDRFSTVNNLQQTVSNVELLEKVCKIFVPLAIANQITSKNAECIQASIVVEVASGIPTIEQLKQQPY